MKPSIAFEAARLNQLSAPFEHQGLSIDLTSLLDVLFMVLVFMLLTANSTDRVLALDLPTEGVDQTVALDASQPLRLSLLQSDLGWNFDGEIFAHWSALESAIHRAHLAQPDTPIVIATERQVASERLLRVLALLSREGIETASLLMDQPGPIPRSILDP